MGLFSKKETCSICKDELTKVKLSDGYICLKCLKDSGLFPTKKPLKTVTVSEAIDLVNKTTQNRKCVESFNPTKKIGNYIEFDDNKKQWLIPDGFARTKVNPKVYNYKDIIEFELLEDGESITKGGLGRAVAGGVLLGGVGAIVGGVTGNRKTNSIVNSLKIKITLNDINNPNVYISLIKIKTPTNSSIYKKSYKFAQDILSVLSIIVEDNDKPKNEVKNTSSDADEILKFKNLLDDGIITQEEFEKKKKMILGI